MMRLSIKIAIVIIMMRLSIKIAIVIIMIMRLSIKIAIVIMILRLSIKIAIVIIMIIRLDTVKNTQYIQYISEIAIQFVKVSPGIFRRRGLTFVNSVRRLFTFATWLYVVGFSIR